MNWFLILLIFLSLCRFGDFSLSKLFDFIEYMQVLCAFGINMLIFFEYMQILSFSLSKSLFFWVYAGLRDLRVTKPAYTQKKIKIPSFSLSKCFFLSTGRFEGLEVHQTCIYSKKINILMPKVPKACIYSKKSKVLIVNRHQTCIYSKKSKISDSMWDGLA